MGIIFGVIIFILVITVAVIVLGGWIVVNLTRGIWRLIVGPQIQAPPQPTLTPRTAQCGRLECGASNPITARFCRRCGGTMMGIQSRQSLKVA